MGTRIGTMQIPFFNYPALFAQREAEYMAAVHDVLRRGAYIMQMDLFEFEENLARYCGVKHAVGVADGTMALLMGLRSAGIEPGAEVIVPSHTFVACAAAIVHAGAKPVLADCGRDHLIDPRSIEEKITSRTQAIMPVQLNGRVADMDTILATASKHGLKIIEDSCQALGAKFKGRLAGTFGVAGAFSFYPSKTLGCFGDGGAVITNDDVIADHVKLLRDHGRGRSGKVEAWGYNSRLDNLQAAILGVKLKRYDEEISRRRQIARLYHERLKDLQVLLLPPGPDDTPDHFDIYQNYEIEAERRDALKVYLAEHGIGTILQWGGHMIHQFDALGFKDPLPATDRIANRYLLLPMNVSLDDDNVSYICDTIRKFYRD